MGSAQNHQSLAFLVFLVSLSVKMQPSRRYVASVCVFLCLHIIESVCMVLVLILR